MCLKSRLFQKRNLREEVINEIVISSQEYEQGMAKLIYYYIFPPKLKLNILPKIF